MDIETRFTMERGTSGFYTYDEYTHKASYPSSMWAKTASSWKT
jgi:hypothetical protein